MKKCEKSELEDVTDKFANSAFTQINKVQNIKIRSDYLDIKIKYTDSVFNVKFFLEHTEDLKTLKIKNINNQETLLFLVFSEKKDIKGYVEFYIPKCTQIIIDSKRSNVDIKFIEAESIKVYTFSGDVNLYNVKSQMVEIRTKEGDILLQIPPQMYKFKLKTISGNIIKNCISSDYSSQFFINCESENGDVIVEAL